MTRAEHIVSQLLEADPKDWLFGQETAPTDWPEEAFVEPPDAPGDERFESASVHHGRHRIDLLREKGDNYTSVLLYTKGSFHGEPYMLGPNTRRLPPGTDVKAYVSRLERSLDMWDKRWGSAPHPPLPSMPEPHLPEEVDRHYYH